MAPPSQLNSGQYQIIKGSLADLARLEPMKAADALVGRPIRTETPSGIGEGRRNATLWRHCMRHAHHCDAIDDLLDVARTFNDIRLEPPLTDTEVIKIAASAWGYTAQGKNLFSRGGSVVMPHADIDGLLRESPDAFILESVLRRHHWGRQFVIANAMAETMPRGGWSRKRFAKAKRELENRNRIWLVRPANYRSPALYGWPNGVVDFDHQ
jgi:hypothetical protein